MKDVAIVYMVAGMSSRFGGKIKQFAKVGPSGETLIEYSLNQALSAGFNKIIFIIGNKTEQGFKEMFGDNYKGIPVLYAKQSFDPEIRDKPWGTADSLCCAKDLIDCGFVVCNGDDIYGETTFEILFNHLQEKEDCATIGYRLGSVLSNKIGVNRGIYSIDEEDYLIDLTETFDIKSDKLGSMGLKENDLCSMNIFALYPSTLRLLEKKLILFKEKNLGHRTAECLLPEELSKLIKQGSTKMKIYPTPDQWFGITCPEDEEGVRKFILEQSD